ncbi:MAG: type II toxin-antitoxin system mRNA interferase toxin, RelE/StbE family [Candidatus Uhrbacteria bacterium]
MSFKIFYSPEFKKDYKKLPITVREQLKLKGQLFQENPFHPRLRTHKLTGQLRDLWAFSVDFRHRAIFEFLTENEILLLRVGDHSIYRKR